MSEQRLCTHTEKSNTNELQEEIEQSSRT